MINDDLDFIFYLIQIHFSPYRFSCFFFLYFVENIKNPGFQLTSRTFYNCSRTLIFAHKKRPLISGPLLYMKYLSNLDVSKFTNTCTNSSMASYFLCSELLPSNTFISSLYILSNNINHIPFTFYFLFSYTYYYSPFR